MIVDSVDSIVSVSEEERIFFPPDIGNDLDADGNESIRIEAQNGNSDCIPVVDLLKLTGVQNFGEPKNAPSPCSPQSGTPQDISETVPA